MNITGICALGVVIAVTAVTIKRYNGEMSLLLCIAGCIFIFLSLLSSFSSLYDTVSKILANTGISVTYITILLKAVGICFVTEFACDICRDAGQSALAAKMEIAGAVLTLSVCLPLFEQVLDLITEWAV